MTAATVMVADDERLLRRVVVNANTRSWDDNLRRWLPSTAGFKIDPDGVSVYRTALLSAAGRGAADVAAHDLPAAVFEVLASDATHEQLDVLADPQPDPETIGFAHALVTFPDEGASAKKRRLRRLLAKATIVHGAEIWPMEPPASPA